MMAHASRDPFWRAKAQQEASQAPAVAAVIEDKCLRCHAPRSSTHFGKTVACD